MRVDKEHPAFPAASKVWSLVRDTIKGEEGVKETPSKYLAMPSGFVSQEDGGSEMYSAYVQRACFPEIVAPAVRGMVGLIHRIPANIALPKKLEPMRGKATPCGRSLHDLHERITREVLTTGRLGLLADLPLNATADSLPYVATYNAETIVNWAADGSFFMLLESSADLDEQYTWVERTNYRELRLQRGTYVAKVFEDGDSDKATNATPQKKFGETFDSIPFVVVGSTDVCPDIDEVPILPVARAALAAYRLDADMRHQLFHSGQSTLFISNAPETLPTVVGAGVIVGLPEGSKAEYVSPDGKTIAAHRTAIQDDLDRAMRAGARLLETEKRSVESGEAIRRRTISQTASLVTVALNSAKGLEQALKHCAAFVGADPEEVAVEPNLSFVETGVSAQEAKALLELWMGGAISRRTLYEKLQQGEIASHERSFEDEMELIEGEVDHVEK